MKMAANLLKSDDFILALDPMRKCEIVDYINIRNQNLPSVVKWERIKSIVVTNDGMTLWQISEKYIDLLNARAIGTVESPVHLFEWIIKKSNDEQTRSRRVG